MFTQNFHQVADAIVKIASKIRQRKESINNFLSLLEDDSQANDVECTLCKNITRLQQLLSQSPFEQLAQYFYPVGHAFCFAGIKIYSSMLPTVLPLVLEFFYY